jgi:hypothetical protein
LGKPGDATRSALRGMLVQRLAQKTHLAFKGQNARQHLKQCRLAGTVWSDNGAPASSWDLHGKILEYL